VQAIGTHSKYLEKNELTEKNAGIEEIKLRKGSMKYNSGGTKR